MLSLQLGHLGLRRVDVRSYARMEQCQEKGHHANSREEMLQIGCAAQKKRDMSINPVLDLATNGFNFFARPTKTTCAA